MNRVRRVDWFQVALNVVLFVLLWVFFQFGLGL